MANANSPPDDIPLVIKTTSMYKVFQDVDALLEEAYSLIGKRPPVSNSLSDENEYQFAMISSKAEKNYEEDTSKRIEAEQMKQGEYSDSYETAGSEVDEDGNIKSKKKAAKVKAKNAVKATTKRQPSKSPARSKTRVNTTKGNVNIVDSESDVALRQSQNTNSQGRVGGDADNVVEFNNDKMNVILNAEQSPRLVRNRRQNN